jgi:hypothetical protein
MKTFKEYIKEHPNLRTRIIKAINPMDKLRDKMDDLKKLPGKIKDKAVDKLKDKMDAINPLSAINISGTEGINKKIATNVPTTPIIPLVHSVDAEINSMNAPKPASITARPMYFAPSAHPTVKKK